MVTIDKNIIKQAYAFTEAKEYFLSIMNKETILSLYKELDYVYDLLESMDIVSHYNYDDFELMKDFEVIRVYDEFFIQVNERPTRMLNVVSTDGLYTIKIDIIYIILEVSRIFNKV